MFVGDLLILSLYLFQIIMLRFYSFFSIYTVVLYPRILRFVDRKQLIPTSLCSLAAPRLSFLAINRKQSNATMILYIKREKALRNLGQTLELVRSAPRDTRQAVLYTARDLAQLGVHGAGERGQGGATELDAVLDGGEVRKAVTEGEEASSSASHAKVLSQKPANTSAAPTTSCVASVSADAALSATGRRHYTCSA
jgi:hypothetical protein